MADVRRWLPVALSLRYVQRALLVLLAAMVLVQTIGLMHRVAHAPQSAGVSVHVVSGTSAVLASLWGEHSHSAECQLFDQSCPDLWPMLAFGWLPVQPVAHWTSAVQREHFAPGERFYTARGPPFAVM